MNKILLSCFFAAGVCFAQELSEIISPTPIEATEASPERFSWETSTPVPAPTPQRMVPASSSSSAPEGPTIFDTLRGHAYNPFGTAGAATAVEDLAITPSDIYGKKFFYGDAQGIGYTAFGLGENSVMLGLDNSYPNLAALILGFATPSFGVALNYSVSKNFSEVASTSIRTTNAGDNIGVYFSMPLGQSILYANASWLTYATSVNANASEDYSTIQSNLGLLGRLGSLDYDAYFNAIRSGGTRTASNGDKSVDQNTFTGAVVAFNVGYPALRSEKARVIIGSNNSVSMILIDEISPPGGAAKLKSDNAIGVVISPNILAEVSLFDNWLAFMGASHKLSLLSGDLDRNTQSSSMTITHSDGTDAVAGVRYQKTNWALEAQVSGNMFNNPFGGFNGQNMFTSFGGFIYF